MKVSFISEHYPPTEGGVAISTQRVARALSRQGASVQVICFDHTRAIDSPDYVIEETDENVRIFKIGPFFLKRPMINVPETVKAIFRRRAFEQMVDIINNFNAELILSFYLFNAGFLAQFVARELHVPFIAGIRGNDIGKNIFDINRFAVIQWVVTGADRIVCVNEHLRKRLLLAFPAVDDKTIVIPNSCSISVEDLSIEMCRNKLEAVTGWNQKDLRLVFIGNLREKKGAFILLKALSLLRDETYVKLLIIGPNLSPFEMRQCGDIWNQLKGSGRIFVTGFIPHTEVSNWALGCDVVVMPSIDDGMANGLIEGMALGLCPIATPIFNEIVKNNDTGIIVPFKNEVALADAICNLSQDRTKLTSLGRRAKTSLATWSPRDEALAYKTLFQTLLSSERRL